MSSSRALFWGSVLALALVTGVVLWAVLGGRREPPTAASPAAPAEVLAFYVETGVKGAPEPMGIRVAEVGFDPQGNAVLNRSSEAGIAREIQAALDEARRLPALPFQSEGPAILGRRSGTGLDEAQAAKGDLNYAWALGGFVRARTGLRYDVIPAVPAGRGR